MKKLFMILSILTLAGCASPMNSVTDTIPTSKVEQQKEMMSDEVHIYSLDQNASGYIIDWNERDKWVITSASAVIKHPKALVETSNGQLLEATVIYVDVDQNSAILHFRNSAVVDSEEIDMNALAKKFHSIAGDGSTIAIGEAQLKEYIDNLSTKGLSFEERQTARAAFENYPAINVKSENKIANYDKATFDFDRDELQQQMMLFIEQYNAFVNNQENDLLSLIANDAVKQIFIDWEVYGEEYTMINSKVVSLSYEGYLYKVGFTAQMGESNPTEVNVQLIYTLENNAYKIITFSINK